MLILLNMLSFKYLSIFLNLKEGRKKKNTNIFNIYKINF